MDILAVFRYGGKLYFIDDRQCVWRISMKSGYPTIMQVHTLPYGVLEP